MDSQPIEVFQQAGTTFVMATRKAKISDVCLPPCTPKQSRVLKESEHPYTVPLKLKVMQTSTEVAEGDSEPVVLRSASYFVNPEFNVPKKMNQL